MSMKRIMNIISIENVKGKGNVRKLFEALNSHNSSKKNRFYIENSMLNSHFMSVLMMVFVKQKCISPVKLAN